MNTLYYGDNLKVLREYIEGDAQKHHRLISTLVKSDINSCGDLLDTAPSTVGIIGGISKTGNL